MHILFSSTSTQYFFTSYLVQRHPDHGAANGGVLFWAHHEVNEIIKRQISIYLFTNSQVNRRKWLLLTIVLHSLVVWTSVLGWCIIRLS
jgi:hypothetical protein